MPPATKLRSQPWLESPLPTKIGTLQLAGELQNVAGIDPSAMRVLGSFALVLMVAGRGYYQDSRGTKSALAPGDVVFVFPELAHAYGPEQGRPWTQVYFVFSGPQFELWQREGILVRSRPVWKLGAPSYWRRRLGSVLQDERRHEAGEGLRAMGRFTQVLAEMAAASADSAQQPLRDSWLEKSLQLLGDRGTGGWLTAQEVARAVGLSYENFRKRFVQQTGESPVAYQKRRRIDRACAALYHGELSLKALANSLEFCDVFHFSKAFKQIVGATPSDYRRRVRGY